MAYIYKKKKMIRKISEFAAFSLRANIYDDKCNKVAVTSVIKWKALMF